MMISDVRMPGISGLETLRQARKEHGVLPVLLVTAYADIRDAVGAMRDTTAETSTILSAPFKTPRRQSLKNVIFMALPPCFEVTE